jgi:hypothetical protein
MLNHKWLEEAKHDDSILTKKYNINYVQTYPNPSTWNLFSFARLQQNR